MQHILVALGYEEASRPVTAFNYCDFTLWMPRAVGPPMHAPGVLTHIDIWVKMKSYKVGGMS